MPCDDYINLSGDFEELYYYINKDEGRVYAYFWLWIQIIKSIPGFITDSLFRSIYMFKNYLKIALRNLKKHKAYFFINITGLAIGMACCILILLWVQDELSYDRFHENSDRICRVVEEQLYAGGEIFPVAVTPGPLAAALKQDYLEILNSVRIIDSDRLLIKHGDNKFYEKSVILADPSIFEIFSFPFIKGNSQTALNQLTSIVITERMAEKYFGDKDPIGKSIIVENQFDLKVTGVIKNIPHNSHLQFDFIVPFLILKMMGRQLDNWGSNSYYTYIQIDENAKIKDLNNKISGIIKEHRERSVTTIYLQPITNIHLHSNFTADIGGHGNIKYVYIFTIIAVFVLIIACINFINLTTARSGNRAKEVGMRKVAGAHKRDIIKQFLGESILLSFLALFLALAIVFLLLPIFNQISGKELIIDFTGNAVIPIGLIATALLTGIISGAYPSFFLSSFQPVKTLKGNLKSGSKSPIFRKALVIVQFSLSIFLIISTIIINRQLNFIAKKKLGFNKEQLIYQSYTKDTAKTYKTLKNELLKNHNILGVTIAEQLPTYIGKSSSGVHWPGHNPDDKFLMHHSDVALDYFETFKMQMAAGRTFSKNFPSDSSAFIINEKALDIMKLESPIETQITFRGITGPVVGVVKNFHFKSLNHEIEPLFITLSNSMRFSYLVIRVSDNDIRKNIDFIKSQWEKINQDTPFACQFLDERFDNLYRAEQRMSTLFNYFTALAVFIACLGLLGLASFMAEQRTKEIGIRKVLGASDTSIIMLLSREFIILVSISNLIAWPLAYYFMNKWLQSYAYHAKINLIIFIISAVAAILIALLTVSYQAYKAATLNPVNSIKYE